MKNYIVFDHRTARAIVHDLAHIKRNADWVPKEIKQILLPQRGDMPPITIEQLVTYQSKKIDRLLAYLDTALKNYEEGKWTGT
jgi:hypothetical protein